MNASPAAVIVDLDGTLVDSVYQHVAAWLLAFTDVGLHVEAARVHAAIGMGGDRLVAHVAGDSTEWAIGDEVRAGHARHFKELLSTVAELDGASELLEHLASTRPVALATSGDREATDQLLVKVRAADVLSAIVSGSDAEQSKPAPDILLEAARQIAATHAVVLGDSVWDAHAANACGFPCVALRSGGVDRMVLAEAGARAVYDGPRDLLDHLAEGPLQP